VLSRGAEVGSEQAGGTRDPGAGRRADPCGRSGHRISTTGHLVAEGLQTALAIRPRQFRVADDVCRVRSLIVAGTTCQNFTTFSIGV